MRQAVRQRLQAQIPGTVIDWGWNAQGAAVPRIVLTVISGADGVTQDGASGLNEARVQVDCYAETYGGAVTLRGGVVAALHGWKSAPVMGAFKINERDFPPDTAAGEVLARISIDFNIHYKG